MRLPGSPRLWRVVPYVFVVGLSGFGLLRLEALVSAEEAEERVEAAERCVASWEVRGQIRDSDERHGQAAGEALIDVVQPDDPLLVEQYRRALAERLRAASEEISDPECDLDHARRVVANDKE